MVDFFGTVEGEENFDPSALMSADDAQTAEEVSAEELLTNLTGENEAHETAVNTGDGDQNAQAAQQTDGNQAQDANNDKFSRRIAAALRSQRENLFREYGMSETEVRELIRAHKAEQMHKEDPEISPKAATEILKLREQSQTSTNPRVDEYKAGISSLIEDGWTKDELVAFTSDAAVRENLNDGMTIRQAARVYLRSLNEQQHQSRRAVPTVRTATASPPPDEDRIASMSDKEFDEFSNRVREAAYAGKRVSFK